MKNIIMNNDISHALVYKYMFKKNLWLKPVLECHIRIPCRSWILKSITCRLFYPFLHYYITLCEKSLKYYTG